ncbi:fibronectin type II domain-containing protein [Sporosarcina limicola]
MRLSRHRCVNGRQQWCSTKDDYDELKSFSYCNVSFYSPKG